MMPFLNHQRFLAYLLLIALSHSFTVPKPRFPSHSKYSSRELYQHFSSVKTESSSLPTKNNVNHGIAVEALKEEVEALLIQSNGEVAIETLEPMLERIEAKNTVQEPNRDPSFKGRWHVWYTNCPPPSNGRLGPFQGSAEQDISTSSEGQQGDAYNNILRLPANSKDGQWLTVVLDGVWEEWDGNYLPDDDHDDGTTWVEAIGPQKDQDLGASFWKVTFLRLNFNLFGNLVFSKEFPARVARIWRSTYLDDDTKIVRAGRTGRADDESVFYMKRSIRPTNDLAKQGTLAS
jgi:hypothetical protein